MAGREYSPEFRRQIIELHRAGRSVAELAREFEPGEQTIRNWIRQAEIDEGGREGLTTEDREELRRLRRENRQLKLEREILKKSRGLVCSGERLDSTAGFEFMKQNQALYPVRVMARVLGLSPSGFYAWLSRAPSARATANAALTARIRVIHRESRESYGRPRIVAELQDAGVRVGKNRVARLMKTAGIEGVSRRRKRGLTRRDADARPAADLVDRNFAAEGRDQLWVADITYVPTRTGFLYLSVVLDAWSRRVVGWSMATHLRSELVLGALDMALSQRRPKQVIHHSDQGTQYTSIAFVCAARKRACGLRWARAATATTTRCARVSLLRDAVCVRNHAILYWQTGRHLHPVWTDR